MATNETGRLEPDIRRISLFPSHYDSTHVGALVLKPGQLPTCHKSLLPFTLMRETCRVETALASILANYPDYFPPNFDSLFLQDREATFNGAYRTAFYV